ncbi:hypothetical protein TraAM80_01427 [Trypanosoma rangeli]|uniref:Uncharacterized protein n=1 Tax=Trypanosoma rangeli TaxID=5698 RepID=A0A422NYV9_TRYRA|nr:uncharacterized protein TraAM80_01427 [Trypanosoma rangeli]RNF10611.1 hypothetical protein TraAM80_01427 [Trypanosoma rangeli]|eukprot:RNF10611.1 hypothetical protein TraAM80_01427 [Trypanosoma rangeli]
MSPGPCGQMRDTITFYGSKEGNVKAFQFWIGKPIASGGQRTMAPVTALLVVPMHSLLWCGDEAGGVTVFRLSLKGGSTGGEVSFSDGTLCVAYHPASLTCFAMGGNDVYSGSADGTLYSWSLKDPFDFTGKVGQHTGELAQMVLMRDDYLVSVGPDSAMVHVWPLGKRRVGQAPFALLGHTGGVLSGLYVPSLCSGGLLWSAGEDCFIHVWDVSDPVHLDCLLTGANTGHGKAWNTHTSSEEKEKETRVEAAMSQEREDSLQVNSMRMLVGHKESVVALCSASGVVFSCDSSGLLLAWNPHRYWLLHAFTVLSHDEPIPQSLSTVPADKDVSDMNEVVRGAHCLGFMEGFLWNIDTAGGPRCIYMPIHSHLKKLSCNGTADVSLPSGEGSTWSAFTSVVWKFMQDTVSLFVQHVEFCSETFAYAVEATLREEMRPHCGSSGVGRPASPGGFCKEGKDADSMCTRQSLCESRAELLELQAAREALVRERELFTTQRREEKERWRTERQRLKEEAMRLEERAGALSHLEETLQKAKREQDDTMAKYEELWRRIKAHDQERERQLVRVSAEVSFLRLKYADWSGVKERDV